MPVRAEFPSLADWLTAALSEDELGDIALLSFNQWTFTTAPLIETALTAHELGSRVTVGFWVDRTPLPDTGWSSSRVLARLLGTRTKDQNAERALLAAGFPASSIVKPPITNWRPVGLPALPDPLTRAAIRRLDYQDSGMGRSILQVHPDATTPIRDDYVWPRGWIHRATESYAWVYDQTSALIRELDIRTLVVFNGRFTHDRAAAAAATAAGARVLYYDTGGLDTDFDLTTSTTHDWAHLQERMLTMWDDWADEPDRDAIASTWFENRQAHAEPGIEIFVGLQERGNVGELPEANQIVVFFSSSGDEIAELDLDWAEYLHSQESALAALAEACRCRPGTALVVRTHPHMRLKAPDDLREWMAAVDAAGPAVHFDPSSTIDSYALMRAADVVFTYGSTSGVEAAYIGRPVAVMGPSAYDLLGCASRVRTTDEISQVLESPPAPRPDRALLYGLMMQRRGFNYAHVRKHPGADPTVAGVSLSDPHELVKNLSHERKLRLTRRLTAER